MPSYIRRLLLIVASFACVLPSGAQVNATWTWRNYQQTPWVNRRVTVTPLQPFANYNGAILSSTPLILLTDAGGNVLFTNLTAGYAYRAQLDTPYGSTIQTNGFPVGLSGNVSAVPYLGTIINNQTFCYFQIGNASTNAPFNGGVFSTDGTNTYWAVGGSSGATIVAAGESVSVSTSGNTATVSVITNNFDLRGVGADQAQKATNTLSANILATKATSSTFGLAEVDGVTILSTAGVISAVGGTGGNDPFAAHTNAANAYSGAQIMTNANNVISANAQTNKSLQASTVMVTDALNGQASSITTVPELAFVHGVTSGIQTQLANGTNQSTVASNGIVTGLAAGSIPVNGAGVQAGTINSNKFDALTKAQLALAGSAGILTLNGNGTNTTIYSSANTDFHAALDLWAVPSNANSENLNLYSSGLTSASLIHIVNNDGKASDFGIWSDDFGSSFGGKFGLELYDVNNKGTAFGPAFEIATEGKYGSDSGISRHIGLSYNATNLEFDVPLFLANGGNGWKSAFHVNPQYGVTQLHTTTTNTVAGSGTVTITGNVIVGAGTDFLNQMQVGDIMYVGSDGHLIISIADGTHATCMYPVSESAGSSYSLFKASFIATGLNGNVANSQRTAVSAVGGLLVTGTEPVNGFASIGFVSGDSRWSFEADSAGMSLRNNQFGNLKPIRINTNSPGDIILSGALSTSGNITGNNIIGIYNGLGTGLTNAAGSGYAPVNFPAMFSPSYSGSVTNNAVTYEVGNVLPYAVGPSAVMVTTTGTNQAAATLSGLSLTGGSTFVGGTLAVLGTNDTSKAPIASPTFTGTVTSGSGGINVIGGLGVSANQTNTGPIVANGGIRVAGQTNTGTFALTSGTLTSGFVLTEDAAGNGTWQASGGSGSATYNNNNLTNANGIVQVATNPSWTNANAHGATWFTNAVSGNYVGITQGGIVASNAASLSRQVLTNDSHMLSNGITGNLLIASNALVTVTGTGSGFKGDGSQVTGLNGSSVASGTVPSAALGSVTNGGTFYGINAFPLAGISNSITVNDGLWLLNNTNQQALMISNVWDTGAAISPFVDITGTWSTTGTAPTAFRMNITNTASAGTAVLMDLQVSGISEFKIMRNGAVTSQQSMSANAITAANGAVTATSGNLVAATAGFGLQLKGGSNAKIGQATLASGTVTVANSSVTANSFIIPWYVTPTGTVGSLSSPTNSITAGTSFIINSVTGASVVQTLDSSVIGYMIIEKN